MNSEYSKDLSKALDFSIEEAARLGSYIATPDHLFLGILRVRDCDASRMLAGLGIDTAALKRDIEEKIGRNNPVPFEEKGSVTFSDKSKEILGACVRLHPLVTPSHLMAQIFMDWHGACTTVFEGTAIKLDKLPDVLLGITSSVSQTSMDEPEDNKENAADNPSSRKVASKVLESYGQDLTQAAANGELDPVIGREAEIERLAQILCRRKKNNPVLIGESGVGKSAVVEGLAQKIASKEVARPLLGKRIFALDMGSVVAGTKYRGQFEERIKNILTELKNNPDIILFIDELHTIIGAGSSPGSLDAANLLKPALARGQVQCIGATTLNEYREHVEKDAALERRFQKILVEPTDYAQTLAILEGIKAKYEQFHSVKYSDNAIKACISLSQRYISDRCLPDKAIDVMDEAGARSHISLAGENREAAQLVKELEPIRRRKREAALSGDFEEAAKLHSEEKERESAIDRIVQDSAEFASQESTVSEEDIAAVVSKMTGIPVSKVAESESRRLLSMEDSLRGVVVGQDEALSKVVRAIRRNRAGLKNPGKPVGTFLFLGPTGVGKTHLAKKIAEYLFDSEDNIIRIDMSEYGEKFSSSRLVGAPPGYVGYNEGGQLSEQVRRKPYSVVLLDEVEKAHPDIFNLLLQVLDEGRMTDSAGRFIDFKNTVLILTSNIGSRELKDFGGGIGYATGSNGSASENRKSIIDKAISKAFNPEFVNRLDEQIYFNTLSKDDICKIIDIELKSLLSRVSEMGYSLQIMPAAKKFVADVGYDPKFGARPLKRAVQRYIEDPVSEAILEGLPAGSTIKLALAGDKKSTVVK